MENTNGHNSASKADKEKMSLDEKSFKSAYELGYYNGYNDATEEEDYNEDFSEYVEFFDAEEDFEAQDYDDHQYGEQKDVQS